jgi:CheY-like chemotaxis protein
MSRPVIAQPLPSADESASDTAGVSTAESPHAPSEPLPRARVLCVDDNEELLRGLRRQLGAEFELVVASGSEEALTVLEQQQPFDVIVTDLRMPGVNGLTFLRRARQLAPDTERIILTAWADPTVTAVAQMAGYAMRLLTKPCHPRDLREAITDAILRRRARHLRDELATPACSAVAVD